MTASAKSETDPSVTPDAPSGPPSKGAARGELSELFRRLDAMAKIEAERAEEIRRQLDTIAVGILQAQRNFVSLQAIVVNALPSRLLRLTAQHIALLREKAPTARVRLIAPFRSGLIDMVEGDTMDVMDNRVRVHGAPIRVGFGER